jgi:hypothetical protein
MNTDLTTATKSAQRILFIQGIPRALMRRAPLHDVHLDMDYEMAKHGGRGTPVHNVSALKEGKAGHQGKRYAFYLVGVRHSLVCEELVAMVNYPPVWAMIKRPSFGEGA